VAGCSMPATGAADAGRRQLNNISSFNVDFLESGSAGPVVMLVHSSVSGARQWRRLMEDLKDRFRVRAVNLFGYGDTPPWPNETSQSLDDQAHLVEVALPADANEVCLVGHSFGGSVAMKVAARLGGRVSRLVLLETAERHLRAAAKWPLAQPPLWDVSRGNTTTRVPT
jgi:pimeloyl-ACP methyl ester carboxylesterase